MTTRRWLVAAFLLYVVTFAVFAFPWLRHLGNLLPSLPFRPDEELIVWILSWVTHALFDPQARVFDANIFYPAPAQLTGSEHLFFFQSLFAPLYVLTGQPLVATGVVAFLTYPLGAIAMAALLLQLGCSRLVAWVCGLVYAVGIWRVPLNFHVLQYPNLFLPLVALGAARARAAPGLRSGLLLFSFLLAAVLTSFYTAAIACVALGFWVAVDLFAMRSKIVGYVATIALSLLAASLVAQVLLQPYVARSTSLMPTTLPWDHGTDLRPWVRFAFIGWQVAGDVWLIPFAFLALLGLTDRRDAIWRRMVIPGAALCILGTALVVIGLPDGLGQLAAHTPLRNLRGWIRLLLVTELGLCILAAAGLDMCRRRFGTKIAFLPLAAFVLLAAGPRLTALVSAMSAAPRALTEQAEAYRTVKRYTDQRGRGPMLELPAGITFDCEAMLGSTFHWLPLLNGFTGYEPGHARAMRAAVGALPNASALQDLVDLSHVRWILLRPDTDWSWPLQATHMREGLLASGLVGGSFSFDGFTLIEVTAPPSRPRWYQSIAAGPSPDNTALGTPIRPLDAAGAAAMIELVDPIEDLAGADTINLRLRLHNAGEADWPVLVGSFFLPFDDALGRKFGQTFSPLTVYLEMRWTPMLETRAVGNQPEIVQNLPLYRDLLAGETVEWSFAVSKPPTPGRYQLDVRIMQQNGPAFTEPPSRMLRQIVDVKPVAAKK